VYSGKVRDLYRPSADGDQNSALTEGALPEGALPEGALPEGALPESALPEESLPEGVMLVVASDRVSAFDHVLSPGIPGKGELLTTLSLWWFDSLDGVPNHLHPDHALAAPAAPAAHAEITAHAAHAASADSVVSGTGAVSLIPEEVRGRAMLVRSLDMFPIECVVRGYITGSGWLEYQESGTVCGIPLPSGLSNGDRLPEPLFTPAFKAELGDHDENITFERVVELVGSDDAAALRDLSLAVYARAAAIAESRGLILADTKFEFGRDPRTGVITLADEVLTSDSSRYWDAASWASESTPGERMASFDKQIVRDWLAANWAKTGTPPEIPAEIADRTAARYRELLERLTSAA
jgi:phosphoribosylaminoimidazole-succinocarboxamide synthase